MCGQQLREQIREIGRCYCLGRSSQMSLTDPVVHVQQNFVNMRLLIMAREIEELWEKLTLPEEVKGIIKAPGVLVMKEGMPGYRLLLLGGRLMKKPHYFI
ncbi:hypothetical protein SLE2022_307120 [Rubroshorea leprosula]